MKERLQGGASDVERIQHAVDQMWYCFGRRKLPPNLEKGYVPIRDEKGVLIGRAALMKVGSTPRSQRLVVTTILGPSMRPEGRNLDSFISGTLPTPRARNGQARIQQLPAGAKAVVLKNNRKPQRNEPELELAVDQDVKAATCKLLEKWDELYVEGEHWGGRVNLKITFLEQSTATACAKMLWHIQEQEYGDPERANPDGAFEALLADGGLDVFCSIERVVGKWREFKHVAYDIRDAGQKFIPVPPSFRQHAEEFVMSLNPAIIAKISADSPDGSVSDEGVVTLSGMAEASHQRAIEWLRLAIARCNQVAPKKAKPLPTA